LEEQAQKQNDSGNYEEIEKYISLLGGRPVKRWEDQCQEIPAGVGRHWTSMIIWKL